MNNKEKLLKQIQICTFVLIDTTLFLDTHPNNREALEYFQKYKNLSQQLREEYVKNYGPLMHDDITSTETWDWVSSPWPWELEG